MYLAYSLKASIDCMTYSSGFESKAIENGFCYGKRVGETIRIKARQKKKEAEKRVALAETRRQCFNCLLYSFSSI